MCYSQTCSYLVKLACCFLAYLFLNAMVVAQPLGPLFKSGSEGYQCFRIPAIVTSAKGTVLAFAEGRKSNCGDAGDIDLVMKRSDDGGKTWSALQVVWSDSSNTCGNPAPVVDSRTGHIILLSTWNLGSDHERQIIDGVSKDTRRIFVLKTTDDGRTWSTPREITSDVKLPNWTWYATGPCNGIQMQARRYRNRLIIPCDHIEAGTKKYFSHTIFSDDGGNTWKLGGSTPADQVNECTVAELPKGKLLLNMRNYNANRIRQTSVSTDGGQSWGPLKGDTTLIEPICQASLIRCENKGGKPILAFSNPASTTSRTRMTVKLSYDLGKTWPKSLLLYDGPSAYSNLVKLPDGRLACLYEAGQKSPYEGIIFQNFGLQDFK